MDQQLQKDQRAFPSRKRGNALPDSSPDSMACLPRSGLVLSSEIQRTFTCSYAKLDASFYVTQIHHLTGAVDIPGRN